MTREQRDVSQDLLALQASLDRFIKKPRTLSHHQVEALLDELTGTLGMCLTPEDYETVHASAPTNPQAFAELVANLGGLGTGDPARFLPVLRQVLATFNGVSRSSAPTLRYPPIARRIAEARAASPLAPPELAALLGISVPSYWDLEAHDDEAFACLSLRQLSTLADALQLSARSLVSDDPASPTHQNLTDVDIGAALRRQLAAMGDNVEALGDHLGWAVTQALRDPATIWDEWCADTLRDVCEPLNLEWRGLLPHR
jgi:hypothetical protein